MKNTTLILFLFFIIFSCKNNDDDTPIPVPDCGCESEALPTTIPETVKNGKLFYKDDSIGNNFNNQKFWIVPITDNCGSCLIPSLIVCNEDILSSIPNIPTFTNINDVISSTNELNSALDIKFTGEIKTICNPIFAPSRNTFNNITLTYIELQ